MDSGKKLCRRSSPCLKPGAPAPAILVGKAEPLPDAFSMKYTSVIAFGRVFEVGDDGEKRKALVALVEKYASSREYIEKGRQYADDSLHGTTVLRLNIEHLAGKARR